VLRSAKDGNLPGETESLKRERKAKRDRNHAQKRRKKKKRENAWPALKKGTSLKGGAQFGRKKNATLRQGKKKKWGVRRVGESWGNFEGKGKVLKGEARPFWKRGFRGAERERGVQRKQSGGRGKKKVVFFQGEVHGFEIPGGR